MESGRQSRQKTESQRTRLAEAITNGRLYQTKVILTDFTNLNYLDDDGLSPLIRAFMIEDIKHRTRSAMVKLLINHNADVNLRDKNGQHVLNWACKMNKFDLVKLLLEKCLQDVELISQDIEGNTPLIYAVMNNNVNMVKLIVNALKKFSLSVDHRNKLDKTAYLTALDMGFNECASILSQIGRASQDIKVNPFLDFFSTPNTETSRKIRVRSAPLPRDFDRIRDELNESKTFNANTENTYVNDSLFDGKRTYFRRSKKLSKKLFKSRKIHNIGCEEAHDKNGNTLSQETIKPGKIQRTKTAQNCQNFKNVVEDKKLNSTAEQSSEFCKNGARKSLRKSREGASSATKTEPLLRILLNERQSQSPSEQNSPRSSTCNTSCNQEVRERSRPVISPTVNGYFSSSKVFPENNEFWRKEFPNYHSYLIWKASQNHPPNSLRNFLALRAEQQSEGSSYRKGIAIPKYEPASEESVCTRSGGAMSPASERSNKTEAGRKISAVAKTVGLSIYLTNKRKISHKKDLGIS